MSPCSFTILLMLFAKSMRRSIISQLYLPLVKLMEGHFISVSGKRLLNYSARMAAKMRIIKAGRINRSGADENDLFVRFLPRWSGSSVGTALIASVAARTTMNCVAFIIIRD